MSKRKNNIGDLLDNLKVENANTDKGAESIADENKAVANPAVGLATNSTVKRATSVKEPVLNLSHDQVRLFKYHDRHESALDTAKVAQIRKSIENDGQHFPGIVRKTSDATLDGRMIYELIVGRLRFEGSRGVGVFKAFLKDLDDVSATRIMFAENENRQDITPFERWLSVIPLVKDKVMESKEIAELIDWDPGNLSRSSKAVKVYEECKLDKKLVNVSKVKMTPLIELSKAYEQNPNDVKKAISFVSENYPTVKNNVFLKAVLKQLQDTKKPKTGSIFLDGSKVRIKKVGDTVTLSFKGLPRESDFKAVLEKLKELEAVR